MTTNSRPKTTAPTPPGQAQAEAQNWAARLVGSVLVVGVGNEHRGDDGAGMAVARLLQQAGRCPVLLAEEVPENYLGPIIRAGAATVIFCDAVNLGKPPGAFALLSPDQLAGPAISTHNPSLRLLARCLYGAGIKQVLIAAIQPHHIGWGPGLSPAVQAGVRALAELLAKAIKEHGE
jgi:hydrogenase maturation protease